MITRRISQPKMRRLSETAKTWLMVIPVAIAAAYVGRRAAELGTPRNLSNGKWNGKWNVKSNRANTVRGDAVGSKDGI
ncbi:unnamed protein product [Camellia sinensis]